jgi:hypothetical protein
MPKVDIYALDQDVLKNSNITLGIDACQSIKKKKQTLP